MLMSAVCRLFDGRDRSVPVVKTNSEERFREGGEKRSADCKIAVQVWEAAIYLGPGGPVMRDR